MVGLPTWLPARPGTTRWESVPVLVAGASTVESSIGLSASVCTFDAQDGALTLDAEDNAISDLRCWITFKDAAAPTTASSSAERAGWGETGAVAVQNC
jgi:hypothetical protein